MAMPKSNHMSEYMYVTLGCMLSYKYVDLVISIKIFRTPWYLEKLEVAIRAGLLLLGRASTWQKYSRIGLTGSEKSNVLIIHGLAWYKILIGPAELARIHRLISIGPIIGKQKKAFFKKELPDKWVDLFQKLEAWSQPRNYQAILETCQIWAARPAPPMFSNNSKILIQAEIFYNSGHLAHKLFF